MTTIAQPCWFGAPFFAYSGAPLRPLPKLVALLTVAAATFTSSAGLANAVTPSVSAVTPAWGTY
jgi:hypothetical protein